MSQHQVSLPSRPHSIQTLMTRRQALGLTVSTAVGAAVGWNSLASAQGVTDRPHTIAQATPLPGHESARTPFTVTASDGLTLAAEAQGDPVAPEIVFVHGIRQAGLVWDQQFDDPQLAGFRLIRYDLRGHGNSDRPDDPAAYSDLGVWAGDLAAVIAAAGLRRPVLVGWSLGGQVIGGYLDRYGGDGIAALNMVDAVTSSDPTLLTPLSVDFAQRLAAPDLSDRSDAAAQFLRACFEVQPDPVILERLLVVNGLPPLAMGAGTGFWELPDLDALYAAFAGPVLITYGERDRLIRPEMPERAIALNADATLSVYPGAGHSPFFEQPERFGEELAVLVSDATSQ